MDPVLDEYLKKKFLQDQQDEAAANNKEADNQMYTNMGRAFDKIGSSLGGVESDSSFYEGLDKQRQQQVVLDKVEAERLDRIRNPSKYLGK